MSKCFENNIEYTELILHIVLGRDDLKAEEDAAGLLWKKQFWKQGEALEEKNGVLLRKIDRRDKENFLKLQEENPISRTVMNMEACRDMLWKEHVEKKRLCVL